MSYVHIIISNTGEIKKKNVFKGLATLGIPEHLFKNVQNIVHFIRE